MRREDVRTGGENRPDPGVRAFGSSAGDLEVDFAGLPRPVLVTEVLRLCLQDGEEVWSWTLPRRTQALIAAALASGEVRLQRLARCPERECGETVELEIELAAFLDPYSFGVQQNDVNNFSRAKLAESAKVIPAKAGIQGLDPRFRGGDARGRASPNFDCLDFDPPLNFDWSPEPGRTLRVALPTGSDQNAWVHRGDAAPRAMVRQLIEAVDGLPPADDWQVPEEWIEGLESELERRDPLTALELQACCPACGTGLGIEYDLEAELLRRFEARQARMLSHVDRLARIYHWTEAEILRLPAWRRDYYLGQLDEG